MAYPLPETLLCCFADYHATIEQHMKGDTSGHFMRMLIALSNVSLWPEVSAPRMQFPKFLEKLYLLYYYTDTMQVEHTKTALWDAPQNVQVCMWL